MNSENDMTYSTPGASAPPTYPDLAGRVALVTGGSGALGAATCRMLARNGARVAVNGRNRAAIDAVVEAIAAEGGTAIGVAADCSDAGAVEGMRREIADRLGPVEILMTFAGGDGAPQPLLAIDEARWRSVVDGNLTSTFLTLRAFLPGMVELGRGSVVTMASAAARAPSLAAAPYAAAKAGVIALTRQAARELGPQGIRVNCVSPSAVRNARMTAAMTEEQIAGVGATFPLGRIGEPDDVALAALFLASDASAWITGVTLDVAGGKIMG